MGNKHPTPAVPPGIRLSCEDKLRLSPSLSDIRARVAALEKQSRPSLMPLIPGYSEQLFMRESAGIFVEPALQEILWEFYAFSPGWTDTSQYKDWTVNSVAFSPEGQQIISGGYQGIRFLDLSTNRARPLIAVPKASQTSFAVSPTWVISGHRDGCINIWDGSARFSNAYWKMPYILSDHKEEVTSLAISPDEQWIASGTKKLKSKSYGEKQGGEIRLWSTQTRKCIHVLMEHTDDINSVTFSPCGQCIASGSKDGTIRIWNTGDGQCISIFKHKAVVEVAFSPNGQWIASRSVDCVQLWDSKKKKLILTFHKSHWVCSIAFSPCGRWLVSGHLDPFILKLWDTTSGKCVRIFRGHTRSVRSVAFSSCGQWLVSGSDDGTVRLWNIERDGQVP